MSKHTDLMLELRTKSIDELFQMDEDRRAELFGLRFQAAIGSLGQTHRITELRREIARIELLISDLKRNGQKTSKNIKADYAEAVIKAEKAGKEIRKQQREQIEEMQKAQAGNSSLDSPIDEDMIAKAMAAASGETENAEIILDSKQENEVETPVVKKPTVKETKTQTPVVKKPTTKTVSEPKSIDRGVAIGTGVGDARARAAAAAADAAKKINRDAIKHENVEEINLRLKTKDENAKTYTYGSNVADAKQQIEAGISKNSKKITSTKSDANNKPKTTTTKKGATK